MIICYTHQGKFEKARKFLELAPDKLDIACWNAMIVGYAKKEWENEFGNAVFREDGGEKCCFLEFSYYSACVNLAALQLGEDCSFFANSLFMDMPSAGPVSETLPFSVFTPYYSETVLYSTSEVQKENEDGISILFYLQKIFPDVGWISRKQHDPEELGGTKLNSYLDQNLYFLSSSKLKEPLSINAAMSEQPLLKLTLVDILKATDNFSKTNIIRDGGLANCVDWSSHKIHFFYHIHGNAGIFLMNEFNKGFCNAEHNHPIRYLQFSATHNSVTKAIAETEMFITEKQEIYNHNASLITTGTSSSSLALGSTRQLKQKTNRNNKL
ncbi:hypothetical protein KIW84_057519 [Lathyrus oleraceus]|uniref:Glycosyl transferase 48 domain-containing protein n=1 Tax=Pisum sativum TaxID=3888 RepID=A0A9D4X3D9_PEA|nr:hypothetical protein KIW84_057519 [Pisum sativum]